MGCLEMVDGDRVVGHICVPDGKAHPVPHRRKKWFWCFKCRKHLLHTWMIFEPKQPSYYDPHCWWDCPECHEENVLFPGWEWKRDE